MMLVTSSLLSCVLDVSFKVTVISRLQIVILFCVTTFNPSPLADMLAAVSVRVSVIKV